MHLEFRIKPINDKKGTYWTSPAQPNRRKASIRFRLPPFLGAALLKPRFKNCEKKYFYKN